MSVLSSLKVLISSPMTGQKDLSWSVLGISRQDFPSSWTMLTVNMRAMTYSSCFHITQLWNCLPHAALVCAVRKACGGSLYFGEWTVHCVEWIGNKLGPANMKGITPFVGTNFMCLRRDSRMAEKSSLASFTLLPKAFQKRLKSFVCLILGPGSQDFL